MWFPAGNDLAVLGVQRAEEVSQTGALSHGDAWSRVVKSADTVGAGSGLESILSRDVMETSSPAMSVAIGVLAVLLSLTGFGVYQAFGPPSKALDDPFDDHED